MIEGINVRLRPIASGDLSLLRQWFDDPETIRLWGRGEPIVRPDAFETDLRERFAQFDHAGYFMIEPRDCAPIGRIEFERLEMRTRSAEVMILIGDRAARGKGYGTDAMVALLRYLFHERNLLRVSLTVLAWNTQAIRSYEKVGFDNEGCLRDDVYFDGEYHDQIAMAILRPEFEECWGLTVLGDVDRPPYTLR